MPPRPGRPRPATGGTITRQRPGSPRRALCPRTPRTRTGGYTCQASNGPAIVRDAVAKMTTLGQAASASARPAPPAHHLCGARPAPNPRRRRCQRYLEPGRGNRLPARARDHPHLEPGRRNHAGTRHQTAKTVTVKACSRPVPWRQDPRTSRQAHPPCKSSESVRSPGPAWVSVFAVVRRDLAQSAGAAPIPTLASPNRMSSSGPLTVQLEALCWAVAVNMFGASCG
jgi:hypothetical protein